MKVFIGKLAKYRVRFHKGAYSVCELLSLQEYLIQTPFAHFLLLALRLANSYKIIINILMCMKLLNDVKCPISSTFV